MRIGTPREIKVRESRAALLPAHVAALAAAGHEVLIQAGAGLLAGASDDAYAAAGATIAPDAAALYGQAQMIVKVKEILRAEFPLLRPDHIVVANLYCERDPTMLDRFLEVGLTAIAAERPQPHIPDNSPLCGEIAALEGLRLLLAPHGGTGRHFMRHAGVEPARVVVIGLGRAGRGALRTLLGLGASVIGFDVDPAAALRAELDWQNHSFSVAPMAELSTHLRDADLVMNCVRWDKTRRDHLIGRDMLPAMRAGAVIVDVACDRAGAVESCAPTTWDNPTYQVAGVTHFCVENLPSATPIASSQSFGDHMMEIISPIAAHGLATACRARPWLIDMLICGGGALYCSRTATLQQRARRSPDAFLARGAV